MGRGKCKFNAELQQLFPCLEKRAHNGDNESGVYCKICRRTFCIANGGRAKIRQHFKTNRHKEGELALQMAGGDTATVSQPPSVEESKSEDEEESDSEMESEQDSSLSLPASPVAPPSPEEPKFDTTDNNDVVEELEESNSMCMVCGVSFSSSKEQKPRIKAFLDKFLRLLKTDYRSSSLLQASEHVSMCGQCLSSIVKATARREHAEQVEVVVRTLQQELLRMLGDLNTLMNGYLEEMSCLGRKIRNSNLNMKAGPMEHVFRFREDICSVVDREKTWNGKLYEQQIRRTNVSNVRKRRCEVEPKVEIPETSESYREDPDFLFVDDNSSGEDITTSSSIPTPKAQKRRRSKGPRIHRKSQEAFPCGKCGKNFKSEENLKYHVESAHDPVKRYLCSKCPRTFKARSCLLSHQKIHEDGATVISFQCTVCFKRFKSRATFEGHVKVHQGEGFTCEFCGVRMGTQKGLGHHLKSHQQETLSCDKCSATFHSLHKWTVHQKCHEVGKREWRCETCNKAFHSRKYLKAHLRIHRDEKPYHCGTCGMSYHMRLALYRHEIRVHGAHVPWNSKTPMKGSEQNQRSATLNSD